MLADGLSGVLASMQGLVRVFDGLATEEAAADEQRSVQEAAGAVLLDLEMVAKHAQRLLKASTSACRWAVWYSHAQVVHDH